MSPHNLEDAPEHGQFTKSVAVYFLGKDVMARLRMRFPEK